ncbi:DGQHR domain-containing protein [Gluconobacter sp. Dm-74]|uniref:DGQHR domain-containing protein n=1 Tax=Gluconobacter sp. Dm-74 TaxID=2799803 RepID=UPI001B8C7B3F|nr:DGQHR domain-containing protein [Gluconobacter sp. Dm-74]MBS1090635.1 DGQHR domain-containing protein [Gluconobacter sp. Dm-74]
MSSLTFDCLPYDQPGGTFYACVMLSTFFIHRVEINRRSEDPKFGIQRDEDKGKIKNISKFCSEVDVIFPTPIIIAANSDVVHFDNGKIYISDNGNLGMVIDGQHRLLGIKRAYQEFGFSTSILIVFCFDIDPYSQAKIFSTINSNQKPVSKSLMYDLFGLDDKRSIEKTCHEIAVSLNNDSESPFYKKIKILGKKMDESESLSQAAFSGSIEKQIRSGSFKKYYLDEQDAVIRKIIFNCFTSLKQNLSDKNVSYFYKTAGYGGMMRAMSTIIQIGDSQKDLSVAFFNCLMKKIEEEFQIPVGVGNSAMIDVQKQIETIVKNIKFD